MAQIIALNNTPLGICDYRCVLWCTHYPHPLASNRLTYTTCYMKLFK